MGENEFPHTVSMANLIGCIWASGEHLSHTKSGSFAEGIEAIIPTKFNMFQQKDSVKYVCVTVIKPWFVILTQGRLCYCRSTTDDYLCIIVFLHCWSRTYKWSNNEKCTSIYTYCYSNELACTISEFSNSKWNTKTTKIFCCIFSQSYANSIHVIKYLSV